LRRFSPATRPRCPATLPALRLFTTPLEPLPGGLTAAVFLGGDFDGGGIDAAVD